MIKLAHLYRALQRLLQRYLKFENSEVYLGQMSVFQLFDSSIDE